MGMHEFLRPGAFPGRDRVHPVSYWADPDCQYLEEPLDRRLRFSLDGLLRNPSRYQNLSMRAVTANSGVLPQPLLTVSQNMIASAPDE